MISSSVERQDTAREGSALPQYRIVLGRIGFISSVISVLATALLEIYIMSIGGLSADWSVLRWARVTIWLALLALLLSLFGRGRTRRIGVLLSSVVIIFWLLAFWGV